MRSNLPENISFAILSLKNVKNKDLSKCIQGIELFTGMHRNGKRYSLAKKHRIFQRGCICKSRCSNSCQPIKNEIRTEYLKQALLPGVLSHYENHPHSISIKEKKKNLIR